MVERDLGELDLDLATDPVLKEDPAQLARDLASGPRTIVPPEYDGAKLANVTIAPPKLGAETIVMEMLGLSKFAEIEKKRKELMGSAKGEKSAKRFIFGEGHEFSEEVLTQALLAANKEVFNAFLALDEIPIINNGSGEDDDSGADSDDGRKKRKSRPSPMEVIDAFDNKGLLEKAIIHNPQKAFELKAPLLAQMKLTKPDGGALERYNVYLDHVNKIAGLGLVEPTAVKPGRYASEVPFGQRLEAYMNLAERVGVKGNIIDEILYRREEKVKCLQAAIKARARTLSPEKLAELVQPMPWEIITRVRRGLERIFLDPNIINQKLFDKLNPGELTALEKRIFDFDEQTFFIGMSNLCEANPAQMVYTSTLQEEKLGVIKYYKARLEELRKILESLFSELRKIDKIYGHSL